MNRKLEIQLVFILVAFGLSTMISSVLLHSGPYGVLIGAISLIIAVGFKEHANNPDCKWCGGRHKGRCMYNPRSGKILANTKDGYFDYNNPNV